MTPIAILIFFLTRTDTPPKFFKVSYSKVDFRHVDIYGVFLQKQIFIMLEFLKPETKCWFSKCC